MDVGNVIDAACQTDGDKSTSPANKNNNQPWYKKEIYRRYWNHRRRITDWFNTMIDCSSDDYCLESCKRMAKYHTAMASWMKQMESYYTNWYYTWLRHQQTLAIQTGGYQAMNTIGLKRSRSKQWLKSEKRQRRNSAQSSESREMPEHEQFEMEITPAMRDFFLQSAKYKEERDAKKKEVNKVEDERIDIGDVNSRYKKETTELPPSDQPGIRRTAEMRLLYGKGAPMIHGMETAMQLNYDRNCDLQQSKLWPQLPINIKFT